jgi:hypothetical protein
MNKVLLLMFFFMTLAPVNAQVENQQVWMDLYSDLGLGEKWRYNTELGIRLLLNGEKWSRYNLRNIFIYRLHPQISLASALNIHSLDKNFATRDFELRPWQGIRINVPLSTSIGLSNFLRFEERFLFYRNGPSRFVGRVRYDLSTRIPIKKRGDPGLFYIPLANEFLITMKKDNRKYPLGNRYSLGLGCHFSRLVSGELGFSKQYLKSPYDDVFTGTDNIIRFRLRYKWD